MVAVALAVVTLAGCGGKDDEATAPVSGRVTVDGKPLSTGEVVFVAKNGKRSKGNISDDGTFTLTSPSGGDSPIGPSSVCVTAMKPAPSGDRFASPVPLIPPRFGQPEHSGMTWDVAEGSNRVHVELFSNGRGRVSKIGEGE